jgi:hypothetical protein
MGDTVVAVVNLAELPTGRKRDIFYPYLHAKLSVFEA